MPTLGPPTPALLISPAFSRSHLRPIGCAWCADLSGEDPFLGFTLVQPVVKGIQSQGVVANAKHYIQNNQEGLGQ